MHTQEEDLCLKMYLVSFSKIESTKIAPIKDQTTSPTTIVKVVSLYHPNIDTISNFSKFSTV